MSQSFTFGFDNGDIEEGVDGSVSRDREVLGAKHVAPEVLPRVHDIEDIVSREALRESSVLTLAYLNVVLLPQSYKDEIIRLSRRELFDIRVQLMAEEELSDNEESTESLIGHISTNDIQPNIYEGGFKTWECSMDLATYLAGRPRQVNDLLIEDCNIIELGAGTALPTLALFQRFLGSTVSPQRRHLILADYNPSVLELATIPNFLLTWASHLKPCNGVGDLEFDPTMLSAFSQSLRSKNIQIDAISGGWGPALLDLVHLSLASSSAPSGLLILASETIYSPASASSFATLLMELLTKSEEQGSRPIAYVAAKRTYFGVGGGVDEFLHVLRARGGKGEIVWETQGTGIARVIVEVSRDQIM
ncbi:MAG: hypothetical protein Q9167_003566 [Letrouitia subvulpina]